MIIKDVYSHKGGLEYIKKNHPNELKDVYDAINTNLFELIIILLMRAFRLENRLPTVSFHASTHTCELFFAYIFLAGLV